MRWFLYFFLNLIMVVSIVFVGIILYSSGKITQTPALVGHSYREAKKEVSELGLNLSTKGKVKSINYTKGEIVWQYPDPEQPIKRGRSIWVLISDGVPTVKIPDVRNMLLAEAKQKVIAAGAEVGDIAYAYNDAVEKNFVIASSPMNSKIVGKGWNGRISLLVSLGRKKKKFIVPNFRGLTPKEVKDYLDSLNVKTPVVVHNGFSIAIGRGEIYAQKPKPGRVLEEGDTLNLYINSRLRFYKIYLFLPKEDFLLGPLTVDKVEESGISEEYTLKDSGNSYTAMILIGNSPFSAYVFQGSRLIQMARAHEFTW